MKKTLIALAALAATGAFAQSTVSISGIMDAGYQAGSQYGQSIALVNQNGAQTTQINFAGTEDLGGGLKAKFQFQVKPALNNANGNTITEAINPAGAYAGNGAPQTNNQASAQSGLLGGGYSFVGLAGGFGEVQFGTINTATLYAGTTASQFGTAIGSGFNQIFGSTANSGMESAVAYFTPVMSGFQARVTYAPGNSSQYGSYSTTTSAGAIMLRRSANTEIGLSYDNGPLSVKYANLAYKATDNESSNAGVTTTWQTLGAKYNFGVASVAYGYQSSTNNAATTTTTTAQMLSAVVPMGKARLMANIGKRSLAKAGDANDGQTSSFTGLGLEYDLSKRTFVYLRGEAATMNDANMGAVVINGALGSNTTSDRGRNLYGIGISHSF